MRWLTLIILFLFTHTACATVSSSYTVPQYFSCDNSTTEFTFTFEVSGSGDILVYKRLIATGEETLLAITTDYTVAAGTNNDWSDGGIVTTVNTLASTYQLVIARDTASTQTLDGTPSAIAGSSVESALDKMCRKIQELEAELARCVKIPITDTALTVEADNSVGRADRYLGWDSSGNLTDTTGTITADMNAYLSESDIDTSSEIAAIAGDETGTGSLVFGTSPTIATPTITTSAVVNANSASPQAATANTIGHFVGADSTVGRTLLDTYNETPAYTCRRANGTAASPSAVQADENIGEMSFHAYGATGYSSNGNAHMQVYAAENWTDANQGTYMIFDVTPTGSTSEAEIMRLDSPGYVGINETSPDTRLHISGAHVATIGLLHLEGTTHAYSLHHAAASSECGLLFQVDTSPMWQIKCDGSSSNELQFISRNIGGNLTRLQIEQDGTTTVVGNDITADNITTTIVDINSAEILALAATPKELVAAPGAGELLEFVSAVLIIDYGTASYAEQSNPDDLAIEYDNGSGSQIETWDTTNFITAGEDVMEIVYASTGVGGVTTATNVNKNIALINTGQEYITGDGEIRVIVTYRTHDSLSL